MSERYRPIKSYSVYFDFKGGVQWTTIPPHRAIGDAQTGFWVNEDMGWSVGMDAKYWIPPGRVLYVECEREN